MDPINIEVWTFTHWWVILLLKILMQYHSHDIFAFKCMIQDLGLFGHTNLIVPTFNINRTVETNTSSIQPRCQNTTMTHNRRLGKTSLLKVFRKQYTYTPYLEFWVLVFNCIPNTLTTCTQHTLHFYHEKTEDI